MYRSPAELQNPDWEVILKSLHRIDNPQRDRALQGHIGTNPRMILQLVKCQPMQTAVLRAALQALRSENAVVIFECSAGRHRSVGAAEILRQVMQPLISNIKVIHASSQYWHSTCGGTCTECKQEPPLAFHHEIEQMRRDLLSQLERDYPVTCAQTSCSSI